MTDNLPTVYNLYDRLIGLITRYQSNNEDKYGIIAIFRDLLVYVEWHFDNSAYGNSGNYLSVSNRMWELSRWFGNVIAGDYPNQISFTSNINTLDNIIEHYKKVYDRDDIINKILNE